MKNLVLGTLFVSAALACGVNQKIDSGRGMADGQFQIDDVMAEELRQDLATTMSDKDVMAILGDEGETLDDISEGVSNGTIYVDYLDPLAKGNGVVVTRSAETEGTQVEVTAETEEESIFEEGTKNIVDIAEDCLEEHGGFKKKVSSCKRAVVCDLDEDGKVSSAEKRICKLQLRALVKGIEKDLVDCQAMGLLKAKECKVAIRTVMKEDREADKLGSCDLDDDGVLSASEKKLCKNFRRVAVKRKKNFKAQCAELGFGDTKNKSERLACKKALREGKKSRFVEMYDTNGDGVLGADEIQFKKQQMRIFRLEEKKERLTAKIERKADNKTGRIDDKVTNLEAKIEEMSPFSTKMAVNQMNKWRKKKENLLERKLKIERKTANRLEKRIVKIERKQAKNERRIENRQEKQEAKAERVEIKSEIRTERAEALAEATTKKEKRQIKKSFRQEMKATLRENCAYKKKKKRNKCLRNQ